MNAQNNLEKYFVVTENALDLLLTQRLIGPNGMPEESSAKGLFKKELTPEITGFATSSEPESTYFAMIAVSAFHKLATQSNFYCQDIYGRVARVVKGLKTPPIHLPRPWSEFHFRNRIAFYATPRTSGTNRWIADTDSGHQCVRFSAITSWDAQNLDQFTLTEWPAPWAELESWIKELKVTKGPDVRHDSLVEEVDLEAIGSGSVVQNRTFEAWQGSLSNEQKHAMNQPVNHSVRIIGPAGSGKTLALCLRALHVARDESTAIEAKKILMVTHTWAMAERIDGIMATLSGGFIPDSITILPLLYVLKEHGGQIGRQEIEVIGDDSKSGRIASLDIIKDVLSEKLERAGKNTGLSPWIVAALTASRDSRTRTELELNLYDEFTGVLAAEGVALDDNESIKRYLNSEREEWMPPFISLGDRRLVLEIYKHFLNTLLDKGAITTDQFVLDTIRILETFTWRMRRETAGYDYMFVDELQLFDSQERLALELLGRSSKGIPFCTAEDPSQGIFSALHSRRVRSGVDDSVYLESVHRFDTKIFEFIKFIYQMFPLNTIPLRIDKKKNGKSKAPVAHLCNDDSHAIRCAVELVEQHIADSTAGAQTRISVITLTDVDDVLRKSLEEKKLSVVQLKSFDDVEQLSYSRKAIVVAPWEFIGGTQFSHVIVVAAGLAQPKTSFERLRTLTAIYLSCSRAAVSLDIVCGDQVPSVIQEALESGLISEG